MLGLSYASSLSPRLESELATLFTPPPLGSDTPVILTQMHSAEKLLAKALAMMLAPRPQCIRQGLLPA